MFRSTRRRLRGLLTVTMSTFLLGGAMAVSTPVVSVADSGQSLLFGAVGDVASLEKAAGEEIAVHTYGKFEDSVPAGEMITVNAQGLVWSQVASVAPGSSLYRHIVRWADTIKSRGGKIQIAFGHEPEVTSKAWMGTADEYKRAYRKVVDIFRARGVKNVQWVLQLTDWSYRTASTERNYAGKWYPGNDYIDVVGADAYNWHTCGEGRGRDVPLATVAGGVVTFAEAHGKLASLPEFAANNSIERDKWLLDGFAWMKANRGIFVSAFYFNHPPTNPINSECVWPLDTAAEESAFGELARDGWSVATLPPSTPEPPEVPPAPDPTPGLLVGGSGDVGALDRAAGRTVARHAYGRFQGGVPTAEMISVSAQGLPWREVSGVTSSSALYQDIARWADTIRTREDNVQLVFGQEPEVASKMWMGSADEYKRAYRKVVDIFRARGVENVQWVLQLTDWSYRTASTERNYAGKWYPGDDYVDVVGASVYNWHGCTSGQRRDKPLATAGVGLVRFAKAHGKLASLPEFAADETVDREKWLREGSEWIKANGAVFTSVFYVNRDSISSNGNSCIWELGSATEKAAFAHIADG